MKLLMIDNTKKIAVIELNREEIRSLGAFKRYQSGYDDYVDESELLKMLSHAIKNRELATKIALGEITTALAAQACLRIMTKHVEALVKVTVPNEDTLPNNTD